MVDIKADAQGETPSLDTSLNERDMAHFGYNGVLIPESEVSFSHARSGGPGGQNVNKVNTKAILTFKVPESSTLSPAQIERVLRESNRAKNDEIVIHCSETRSQLQNKERALAILNEHLAEVLKPRIARKPTKPTLASKKRRLEKKRERSEIKRGRSQRHSEE